MKIQYQCYPRPLQRPQWNFNISATHAHSKGLSENSVSVLPSPTPKASVKFQYQCYPRPLQRPKWNFNIGATHAHSKGLNEISISVLPSPTQKRSSHYIWAKLNLWSVLLGFSKLEVWWIKLSCCSKEASTSGIIDKSANEIWTAWNFHNFRRYLAIFTRSSFSLGVLKRGVWVRD